ncbi:hypothetical protein PIB30_087714 [Stylosanthes scabra]|uniref:Uncharacterized protein n=1 Tax=Stylosanthes scabra TaxID=79078 RepID=A0ABU6UW20_9FABA|nr:hypothetical protein [Stylosanthes scabra]
MMLMHQQAGRVYLCWDGGNCWNKVPKGKTKIMWVFMNYYRWFVPDARISQP